jgi:hypothetical protein
MTYKELSMALLLLDIKRSGRRNVYPHEIYIGRGLRIYVNTEYPKGSFIRSAKAKPNKLLCDSYKDLLEDIKKQL